MLTPHHRGGLLILTDGDEAVTKAAAQHKPGDPNCDRGRPHHEVEEEQAAVVDREDGKKESAGAAKERLASVIEVLDQLADGNADSEAGNSEVVAAKSE